MKAFQCPTVVIALYCPAEISEQETIDAGRGHHILKLIKARNCCGIVGFQILL